jgi:hypothetical protein
MAILSFGQLTFPEPAPFRMQSSSHIVLSEIMFDPIGSEAYDEFVEIYNLSETDSIDLTGWSIGDEASLDEIVDAGEGLMLPPGAFGLILDSGYLDNSNSYDELIAESAVLFTISGATFGRNGWTNSSPKTVTLRDSSAQIVESYEYSIGNSPGHSDEKIDLRGGNDSSNWTDSRSRLGTPGGMNSVSPLRKDLAISRVKIMPNPVPFGEPAAIHLTLANEGLETVEQIEIVVFVDSNLDSIPQEGETIYAEQLSDQNLAAGDTTEIIFQLPIFQSGFFELSITVWTAEDQNLNNNFGRNLLRVGYPQRSIVINEIMYRPSGDEPEWLELFNRSTDQVQIQDWKLVEALTGKEFPISEGNTIIDPGRYLVVAGDSTLPVDPAATLLVPAAFPSLNNDEEHVQLIDYANTVIDELFYSAGWGGDTGVSLERINPDFTSQDSSNWASSASPFGSTPGEGNSVFVAVLPSDAVLSASPNPFSPDGDGNEDVTIIQYDLPLTTAFVSLKIFDVMGREIRDLLNAAPSGSHREVIWDGRKNDGERASMGVYIMFLEALNQRMGVIKQVKNTVVVAGKL